MTDTRRAAPDAEDAIEREADLVASAMRLVASGMVSRTVVAGLGATEAAIARAVRRTPPLDVVIEPLRRPDDEGFDVLVRRAEAEPAVPSVALRRRRRASQRDRGVRRLASWSPSTATA